MTLSITNRDPAPNATSVSPFIRPRFVIITDDVRVPADRSSLDVYVNNVLIVTGGVPDDDIVIEDTGLGGLSVGITPARPFRDEDLVSIRVVVDDVDNTSPIDETWSFTVADARGPFVYSPVPRAFSITNASPTTISFRITDNSPSFDPVPNVTDMVIENVDLEYIEPPPIGAGSAANQAGFTVQDESFAGTGSVDTGQNYFDTVGPTFTDGDEGKHIFVNGLGYRILSVNSPTRVFVNRNFDFTATGLDWELRDHSFEGRQGRLFFVETGASAGQYRRITTVNGPGLVTYDGAQMTGIGTIRVYKPRGLDVFVGDTCVIANGFPDPDAVLAGWTPVVTVLGNGDLEVTIDTIPVTWVRGDRVVVRVRVSDNNTDLVNVSDIDYSFQVLDVDGPVIRNINPSPSSRGLGLSDNIVFDVTAPEGVDNTTLNVNIGGVAAITAGVGVGNWSTSTVVADGSGGFRVTLIPTAPYADDSIAFVDIQCDDAIGQTGERRVFSVHFGTTVADDTVNSGLGNNIIRVISFDLSESSFGKPKEMKHNGYAWDGFFYVDGTPVTTNVASWFTELGHFPLSGSIVVTSDAGWAIVKATDTVPWIDCTPIVGSGWSMAGNSAQPLNDASFGPDAVLSLAADSVIVVDFVSDLAYRYNAAGKAPSVGDISQRDGDQFGGVPDTAKAIPLGPHAKLSTRSWQTVEHGRSQMLAIGTPSALTLVNELSDDLFQILLQDRSAEAPTSLVRNLPFTGTWQRIVADSIDFPTDFLPLAVASNDGGQATIEVSDWFNLMLGLAPLIVLDDLSTPALPAVEVRDIDLNMRRTGAGDFKLVLLSASPNQVDFLDINIANPGASTVTPYSDTDLGLTGIASSEISAVAADRNLRPDHGYFYAAVSAADDGRVIMFRQHKPLSANRSVALFNGQNVNSLSPIGTQRPESEFVNMSMDIAP